MQYKHCKLDFYLKGLSAKVRLQIFHALKENDRLRSLGGFKDPKAIKDFEEDGIDIEGFRRNIY